MPSWSLADSGAPLCTNSGSPFRHEASTVAGSGAGAAHAADGKSNAHRPASSATTAPLTGPRGLLLVTASSLLRPPGRTGTRERSSSPQPYPVTPRPRARLRGPAGGRSPGTRDDAQRAPGTTLTGHLGRPTGRRRRAARPGPVTRP